MGECKSLTFATYMCPSVPVEYYEMLGCYIEESLNIQTSLIYDSNRSSPQRERLDHEQIDFAYISSTAFLDNFLTKNVSYDLLPVGCISRHPLKGDVLGYYADIILRKDTSDSVKEFIDMRGFKWAYANGSSLSAATQVLKSLKQVGENITFFSTAEVAGNHTNVIEMVLAKKADAAVVDSICLENFKRKHYAHATEIYLLTSWGPLPPHPIVVNKLVPDEIQKKVSDALLNIHKSPAWKKRLEQFNFVRFERITMDNYFLAQDLIDSSKNLKMDIAYY